jgi:hypothetical protein
MSAVPGVDQEERDRRDAGRGGPVREGAERQADRLRRPGRGEERDPGAQHGRAKHLRELHRVPGQRDRQDQGEDQVRGEERLDDGQLEVPDRPGRENLAEDHAPDPAQPPRIPQQVGEQSDTQVTRVWLPLGHVLLEHEASPDQQRRDQRDRIVERRVYVHDLPASCRGGPVPFNGYTSTPVAGILAAGNRAPG